MANFSNFFAQFCTTIRLAQRRDRRFKRGGVVGLTIAGWRTACLFASGGGCIAPTLRDRQTSPRIRLTQSPASLKLDTWLTWGNNTGAKTMRHSLFAILLLVALPVTSAIGQTFAHYYPVSGDIEFHGLRGGQYLQLNSNSARLSPTIASQLFPMVPNSGFALEVEEKPLVTVIIRGSQHPSLFEFDVLKINAAVLPRTSVNDLTFLFQPSSSPLQRDLPIISVPEPSAIAIAAIGIGVALIRHRNRPHAGPA